MARTPTKGGKTATTKKPETKQPAPKRERTVEGSNVPRFGWNTNAEGLAAKAVLVVLAEEGKTLPKDAVAQVRELVPQLAEAYRKGTVTTEPNKAGHTFADGRELTNSMITGRHQYMWFTAARNGQAAVKGEMSREHPLHPDCNARFAAAYSLVKQRGIAKPFTNAELEHLLSTANGAADNAADAA